MQDVLFRSGDPRIEALAAVMDKLSPRDQKFANSLMIQAGSSRLSEKQWFWVTELPKRLDRAEPAPVEIASLAGVVQLLERAKRHLKYPAVLVRVENRDMRLSIAGENSRAPGSINVTTPGNFVERTWFGRVGLDGRFEASRRETPETATAIAAALQALATDPAKAASDYGRLTGVCCFCGTPLTDERSTAAGYGKTCAKHFSLPYPTMTEARASRHAQLPLAA